MTTETTNWNATELNLKARAHQAYATAEELLEQQDAAADRGDYAAAYRLETRYMECLGFAMQLQRQACDMFRHRTGRDILLPDEGNTDQQRTNR